MLARLLSAKRALETPIDAASLGAFRIGLGLVLATLVARFFLRGWVTAFYVEPTFFFTYPGFGWVRPLGPAAMHGVFALLFLAGLLLATGRAFRVAALTAFVLFTYTELIDRTTYLNHYYFLSVVLFLACLLPLDAALVLGKPADRTVPRYVLTVLRVQVGLVYVFAGLAKLRPDWLLRGEPLHLWLQMYDDLPVIGAWLAERGVAIAMSWMGAVFDLSAPFLLLHPRTRPLAFVAVLAFHAITGLLFPIGMFPLIMALGATLFFSPDWPRRVLRVLRGARGLRAGGVRELGAPVRLPRAVTVLLVVHLVVQLAVPLRRFAYPGDTCFTEDGFRFAWQVMLLEKRGLVTYTVTTPDGVSRFVDPKRALRPHQYRQLSTQPDLVLAYAHHLANEARARGEGRVAVHADAWVTWNGRRSQPFVRPDVDLASIPDTLASATRYVPAPQQPQRW